MTKLKNSNCDQIKKKTHCDQNQKLKFLQNYKTQIVTKLRNSNFYNSETQIVTKLKKKKIVTKKLKNKIVMVVIVTVVMVVVRVISFSKNNSKTLHLNISVMCSGQLFAISRCFFMASLTEGCTTITEGCMIN